MISSRLVAAAGLAFSLGSTGFAQVILFHEKTIDLAPLCAIPTAPIYIGTNPSAVAFRNGELFVAGFNNGTAPGPVGIVRRIKTTLPGQPDWSVAFGVQQAPASRGYSGLSLDAKTISATVFAAYDSGTNDPDGISAWNGVTGAKLWSKTARGSSGNSIDPGSPGGNPALGSGLGWLTLLSNGRALQNKTTGFDIWTTTTGFSLATNQGAFYRDIDFSSGNGDVWVREGNNVLHGVRNGDNSLASVVVKYDSLPDADTVNGQNLAVCSTPFGSFVIFNDRPTTSVNQPFASAIRAIRSDGSPLEIQFVGFTAPNGNGFYDFAFDEKSNQLVILDFAHRVAHQFLVKLDPYVSYGSGCPGLGGFVPELVLSGDPIEGNGIQVTIQKGLPGSSATVFLGLGKAATPIKFGCTLHLAFVFPVAVGPLPLFGSGPGTGTFSVGGVIPVGAAGATVTLQAFCLDPNVLAGFSNTQGVEMPIFAP